MFSSTRRESGVRCSGAAGAAGCVEGEVTADRALRTAGAKRRPESSESASSGPVCDFGATHFKGLNSVGKREVSRCSETESGRLM